MKRRKYETPIQFSERVVLVRSRTERFRKLLAEQAKERAAALANATGPSNDRDVMELAPE